MTFPPPVPNPYLGESRAEYDKRLHQHEVEMDQWFTQHMSGLLVMTVVPLVLLAILIGALIAVGLSLT